LQVLLVALEGLQLAPDALEERASLLDDGTHSAIGLLSALPQASRGHPMVLFNGAVMLIDVALSFRDVSLHLLLDG